MNRPVVLQPATRTLLKPSRTKSPTHNEPRYVQSQIHITKYNNNAPNYQLTNETDYTQISLKQREEDEQILMENLVFGRTTTNVHPTLLILPSYCNCNMFWLSNGHHQGATFEYKGCRGTFLVHLLIKYNDGHPSV